MMVRPIAPNSVQGVAARACKTAFPRPGHAPAPKPVSRRVMMRDSTSGSQSQAGQIVGLDRGWTSPSQGDLNQQLVFAASNPAGMS